MSMITVFNARNNKFAKAEKINDDTYTLIFEDGSQKEVKEITFKKWYKEVDASDIQKAPDTQSTEETSDLEETATPTTEEVKDPTLETEKETDKSSEKSEEEKAAEKAKADEKAKAKEEAEKAKAAKKAEKAEKTQAEKEAAAKAKAEKESAKKAEREAKKAEAAAKKAAKDAAAPKKGGNAKEHNKQFFTRFLDALHAKEAGFSKAGARDRNYMSFPAGASGFKYKFVYNEGKLHCSLYIFGPKIVTTALFNALEKYKAEIESEMDGITLDWNAPEEMNTRRVITILNGTDEELIEKGVDTLISFRDVFDEYIDKITK